MNKLKNSLKNKLSSEGFKTLENLDIFLDDTGFMIDSLELIGKWQTNEDPFQKFLNNFGNKITGLEDLIEELNENQISLVNLVSDTNLDIKSKVDKSLAISSHVDGNSFGDE